ncbi:MAG: 4Fe-4S dicluster domain-containing protein [Deltaproteobacteria bacterium]|nr:4Fe-4S dicluster domain-containing protein [Deltaproteobacteria bacterium]
MKKDALKRLEKLAEKKLRTLLSKRTFLKGLASVVGIAALSPAKAAQALSWEEFFRKHYKELTKAEKKEIFASIEAKTKERYGVDVKITDPQPMEGVEFVYCLNLSKCIGCRRCVYACVKENNQSRDPQIQYIKVLELPKGSFDLEKANIYYDHEEVPAEGKFYMPVQCHQCRKPPCVKVCPVGATWQQKDGIVVIDQDWCIGCRYCEAACPYEARRFNFATPQIDPDDINPDQGYLSNRIRSKGVMEKCTFCLHRTRVGKLPACVEICPTGSRKFGNILDKNSDVYGIIQNKRIYVLKEELGTQPRFYYFFD